MTENVTGATIAASNTAIDADGLNPTPTGKRRMVFCTLIVDNTSVTPDAVYDALDAQFPVVKADKDANSLTRDNWIFNIGPA